ncbi:MULTISPECIES: tail chaperonin [Bacillus]|uniref:tail chaperonin n=1 Tax=Bacillus TaxID=1386 RepID=UPI000BF22E6F|nr:tail chaperonin [Bacillus mycoides]PEK88270.1 tail chaperonin [Bacillus mycoides]HDR7632488.1 tail chaperonin [Bacillus mycoides]
MAKRFEKEEAFTEDAQEETSVVKVGDKFDEDDVSKAEQEIFPGGPTYNELEKWKSMYAGEVYLTEFDEENIFVWRPIKRKEYKDIAKIPNADNFYKEERICEKAVLFPANYGFMQMTNGKAGIPTLLHELVLEKSGFAAKTGAMRLS